MAEDDGPGFSTWYGQAEKPPLVDDILSFPKGAQAGTCLHEMMERADFSLMLAMMKGRRSPSGSDGS